MRLDKKICVFYFHKGEGIHLKTSIMQMAHLDPDLSIYLLGNQANRNLSKWVKHILIDEYMKTANEFAKNYVHLSPNNYDFELMCFQRWFVMRDYINKNLDKDQPFVYFDSDTLINTDIQQLAETLFSNKEKQMTICGIGGPQFTFFKNINALNNFCNYLMNYYVDSIRRKELEKLWKDFYIGQKIDGGVCDMTLLLYYYRENKEKFIDLMEITDRKTFDGCFAQAQGYAFDEAKQVKKISVIEGRYYGKKNNEPIEFLGLHFQGNSKKYILDYYKGQSKWKLKYMDRYMIKLRNAIRKKLRKRDEIK